MINGLQLIASGLQDIALITSTTLSGYQQINDDGSQGLSFLFHIEGENKIELKTDITDHFVENNTSIQDHAALPPIKVSVHGFIGELNDIIPYVPPSVALLSSALVPISDFAPSFSITAMNALNQAASAYQAANNVKNAALAAWGSLNGQGSQNNQQSAFTWWATARAQRKFFNIQTPWAIFENMMPESIMPVQDESTNSLTDFFITFKQIRFATTKTSQTPLADGRTAQAIGSTTSTGTSNPPASINVASGITSTGGN
jgi:hypothetical protein